LTKSGAKSSIDFQKLIENMKLNEGEEIQYLGTSIGSPYEVDSKSPEFQKFDMSKLYRNREIKKKKSTKFKKEKRLRNINIHQGNLLKYNNNISHKDKNIKQIFENLNDENYNKESRADYLNRDNSNHIDKEKLKEQAENLDKKIQVKSIFDFQPINLEQNKLKSDALNQTEPTFRNSTIEIKAKMINETNDKSKNSEFLMFSEINENKNIKNKLDSENNNFLFNQANVINLDNSNQAQILKKEQNKESLKSDHNLINNLEINYLQNKNEKVIKNNNIFNQINGQIPLSNVNISPNDISNKFTPQININNPALNSIEYPNQITDIQRLYNNNPQSLNKINNSISTNNINFSNTPINGSLEIQNNNLPNIINNDSVPDSQFQNKAINPNFNLNLSYNKNENIQNQISNNLLSSNYSNNITDNQVINPNFDFNLSNNKNQNFQNQISNNLFPQNYSNKIIENQSINRNFDINSNNYKDPKIQNQNLVMSPPINSNKIKENQAMNPKGLNSNNNKNPNNQDQNLNDLLPPTFSNNIRRNKTILPIQKGNENTQFKNYSPKQDLFESNVELKEDNSINKEIKNRLEKIKQLEMLNSSMGPNEKSNPEESIIENFENENSNFKNLESRIANPPPSFLELEDNLRMDTNFFESLIKQSENFNLETQRRGRRRSRFPDPQWDCAETQIAKLVRYLCEEEVSASYQKYCKPIFEQINTMIESFLYHDNNLEICQNLHMCPVSVDL